MTFLNPTWTEKANSNYGWKHLHQGLRRDMAVGLDDSRARVYSADRMRWNQPDPIRFAAGDPNLYRALGNNPVTVFDPLGLFTLSFGGEIDAHLPIWFLPWWGSVHVTGAVDFNLGYSFAQGFTGGPSFTFGYGPGVGAGFGISPHITITTANSVAALAGCGWQTGVWFAVPGGLGAGLNYVESPGSYWGTTLSLPGGPGRGFGGFLDVTHTTVWQWW